LMYFILHTLTVRVVRYVMTNWNDAEHWIVWGHY
jgi:hypothetical protein